MIAAARVTKLDGFAGTRPRDRLTAEKEVPRMATASMPAKRHRRRLALDSQNQHLAAHRDPFDDRVVDNMLAGYAFVDALVADGVDVFALGQLKHLLELNALVLCGASEARRAAHTAHRAATERRFYDEPDAGIQDVVEWHAGHADEPAWSRAAGVYVRMLSTPQLFIEGNHRTGVLVMSQILHERRAATLRAVGRQCPRLLRGVDRAAQHPQEQPGRAVPPAGHPSATGRPAARPRRLEVSV